MSESTLKPELRQELDRLEAVAKVGTGYTKQYLYGLSQALPIITALESALAALQEQRA